MCEGRRVDLTIPNWLFLLLVVLLSWGLLIVLGVRVFSILALSPSLIGSLFVFIVDAVVGLAVIGVRIDVILVFPVHIEDGFKLVRYFYIVKSG